ncbi:hypothetical protein GCM10022402_14530 [Salinactinospora qingdaonensis]|uniref:Uncharacterized protein n=1 Tax=Salinactinospora qingdaonensis TaxID=702744 RepID=A0ABP7FB84_9ACTN
MDTTGGPAHSGAGPLGSTTFTARLLEVTVIDREAGGPAPEEEEWGGVVIPERRGSRAGPPESGGGWAQFASCSAWVTTWSHASWGVISPVSMARSVSSIIKRTGW